MLKRNAMALAVGSVALFSGCASPPPARLAVEPVLAVRNGGVEAEHMYRIGRQYQGQQRYDKAEEAFLKVLAIDAGHAEARNALGVVYFEQGLIQKAEQQFKLAIAAAPRRAHLRNNLGYLYQEIGRQDEAINAYSETLLIDPDNRRALDGLAALTCKDKSMCVASSPAQLSGTRSEGDAPATAPQPGAAQGQAPTVQLANVAPNVWQLQPVAGAGKSLSHPERAAAAPTSSTIPLAAAVVMPADTAQPPVRRIEIANGNGVTGLARRVGTYLHEQGLPQARLTNHRTFRLQYTEVQYVPGAEPLARDISRNIAAPVRLVAVSRLDRQVPVRLVLGRDFDESQSIAKAIRPTGTQVALTSATERK